MYDGNGIRNTSKRSIFDFNDFVFNLFHLKMIAGTFSFFKELQLHVNEYARIACGSIVFFSYYCFRTFLAPFKLKWIEQTLCGDGKKKMMNAWVLISESAEYRSI